MAVNFYNTHIVANLQLPAITVEALSSTQITGDIATWQGDEQVNHAVIINVRIHTGYLEGERDTTESTLLMDEVLSVLKTNLRNLDDNFRIMEIPVPDYQIDFPETQTTGSQMNVELHKVISHDQE